MSVAETLFAIIRPREQVFETVRCHDIRDAQALAGLDGVDHGVVMRGTSVVVYEFGLFDPPATQSYFALNGRLYAGNAVLYGYDESGETIDIDFDKIPPPTWFNSTVEIEEAIALGLVARPEMRANGALIWQWPASPPEGFM